MNKYTKYWPLLVTLVGALSPMVSPVVEHFWTVHPELVAVLSGAVATFKWLLPSPLAKA
jgi:hypothetical protein